MSGTAEGRAERGSVLVALARGALAQAFGGPPVEPPGLAWLAAPGACFVTLRRDGELRGCIGSVVARRPLADDVRENAVGAALRDPRFAPVAAGEIDGLAIEVSVLSPLEPLPAAGRAELAARLRPGVDGVLLESLAHRGTFLPAVWRHYPEPADFVHQLERKASLDPAAEWPADLAVYRYTVESFRE